MAQTCLFKSTDQNAPPLTGQAGSLIVLLDTLVNGYSFTGVSISSITRSGTTATATVSAADGLRLKTGMYVTVAGASDSLYNGTFAITVTSTTTFTYTMSGTPAASPAVGTLTCHNRLPVTSITRSGSTVTVTLAVADTTLVTNHWITISGSTGGDYDGTWQITVTDSTHFTFTIGTTPATPATGTIVCYRSPPGGAPGSAWTKPFTNSTTGAIYRPPAGNRFYLQITDAAATAGLGKEAQAWGWETATAWNTGTNPCPTVAQAASGQCWRKSTTADSTVRAWTLSADDKGMWLWMSDAGTVATTNPCGFGDLISYKSGDAFHTAIFGTTSFNTANPASGLMIGGTLNGTTGLNGCYIFRAFNQTGTAINCWTVGPVNGAVVHGNTSGVAYPNGADSGLYVAPIIFMEPTGTQTIRGRLRGLFAPVHNQPLTNYDLATNVVGLSGVTLTCIQSHSSGTAGQVLVDTFGNW